MKSEKLQKVLAAAGLGSRRTMESWISDGDVEVNGEVARLGNRVSTEDRIVVRGKPLKRGTTIRPRICLMNKLSGWEVSTRPKPGVASAFSFLPQIASGRWLNVGRLDLSTSGLILFTNHGDLCHRLMHPSTGLDREYAVRIKAELDDIALERLKEGVLINGKMQRFSDIRYYDGRATNHWYHVVLTEGRNREVRRLFESQGVLVSRLKRVRYGPVILPSWLTRGKVVEMSQPDVRALCNLLSVDYPELPTNNTRANDSRHSGENERSVLIPYPDLNLNEKSRSANS